MRGAGAMGTTCMFSYEMTRASSHQLASAKAAVGKQLVALMSEHSGHAEKLSET